MSPSFDTRGATQSIRRPIKFLKTKMLPRPKWRLENVEQSPSTAGHDRDLLLAQKGSKTK